MANINTTPREIIFRLRRFDPDNESAPHWDEYKMHVEDGMTVLEALHEIKAQQEPSLSYRSSCRMGVSGSRIWSRTLNRSSRNMPPSSHSSSIQTARRWMNPQVSTSSLRRSARRSASSPTASSVGSVSPHVRPLQLILNFWDLKLWPRPIATPRTTATAVCKNASLPLTPSTDRINVTWRARVHKPARKVWILPSASNCSNANWFWIHYANIIILGYVCFYGIFWQEKIEIAPALRVHVAGVQAQ